MSGNARKPVELDQLVFRDWQPDDAIPPITQLLHEAYSFLAKMGFNYTATYQDDATTLRRLQSGSSIVAVANGAIVGTVTLYAPKPRTDCAWYTHAHHFGQFGVRPDFQKLGIGRELVRRIEQRARDASATELALDTSEGADHLCRWYQEPRLPLRAAHRVGRENLPQRNPVEDVGCHFAPMKILPFRLDTGDRNTGTAYLPDNTTDRLPVVIYCHGWGVGGSTILPPVVASLGRLLESRPAVLVTFDFFGCGQTGGNYSQMTYGRWHANLTEVYAWVAAQPWADPARIGTFGISSGTTAALRHAIATPACAFVISTATCLGAFIGMPNPPGRILAEHLDELAAGKTAELFGTPFGREFFHDFLTKAPVYGLRALSDSSEKIICPVFFLQGAADNVWRRTDSWLGYQLLKAKGAKYLEMENGDHGLDTVADAAAQEAFAWLQSIDFTSPPRS